MAHHCSALVLHCIDFRIQDALKRFLVERNLLGDADVMALPGAARDLVQQGVVPSDALLRAIEVSVSLHAVSDIHLINHTDCGAYGGRKAFASAEEERAKHEEDLYAAAEAIQERFPNVHVHLHLALVEESDGKPTVRIEDVS